MFDALSGITTRKMLSTLNHTIAEDERSYWSKGVVGLKTIKVSVCGYITKKWQTYLLEWTSEELEHLPHFFEQVSYICYQKGKKEWKIETSCKICPSLFEKVLLMQQNPKSAKLVWNPDNAKQKFSGSKLEKRSYMYDRCNICDMTNCIYDAERKGYDLQESESFPLHLAKDHTEKALYLIRKYYWCIGNMFMFHGKEKNSMKNTSPADTDPALVFKMMKNCKLFEEDDELYDEVLDVRNYLMHSSNQRMPKDDFENCMEVFNEFLTKLEGTSPACYYGKREIEKLAYSQELSIDKIKLSELYEDASKIQKQAITFDIHVSGRFGISKYELQGILKITEKETENKSSGKDAEGLIVGAFGGAAKGAIEGATEGAKKGADMGEALGTPGKYVGGFIGGVLGGVFGHPK